MIFGHEYRAVITSLFLFFMFTGFADATLPDNWILKAFVWSGIMFLMVLFISYELIFYPRPSHPFMEVIVLGIASLSAMFGVHGMVWYIMFKSMGNELTEMIWLSPNLYLPKQIFIDTVIVCFIVYLIILGIVNYYGVRDNGALGLKNWVRKRKAYKLSQQFRN